MFGPGLSREEVAAIQLPPPPPPAPQPSVSAAPVTTSAASLSVPPVPSSSSVLTDSSDDDSGDDLVGTPGGLKYKDVLAFMREQFPEPFAAASYQAPSRFAEAVSWSDAQLSRRQALSSFMPWSSGMLAGCAGLSDLVMGRPAASAPSSSATGLSPLLPPRLVPAPSRKSQRWYRVARPYSGDILPVPREYESLVPDAVRTTFKRTSPRLSAEDLMVLEGSALRSREIVSALDWQQAALSVALQPLLAESSSPKAQLALRILLSMGRSISALTKETTALFGNAVLCRRDALLSVLAGTISQQDVLELRSSTFLGPHLFDVEVIDRVRRRLREDVQVRTGMLALQSSSTKRPSGSTSAPRSPVHRGARPFRRGGRGGPPPSRGRFKSKKSSSGGSGAPRSHRR